MIGAVIRILTAIYLSQLLLACVATGGEPLKETKAQEAKRNAEIYLEAVQGLINQEQYYAALAHIQQDRLTYGNTPTLQLLAAECHRKLGQKLEAQRIYEALQAIEISVETRARALHGLGLLAASSGKMTTAIAFLAQSAELLPTVTQMRNDYGYALLRAKRYREANIELATAVELSRSGEAKMQEQTQNNLIILLFATGRESDALKMAAVVHTPQSTLMRLRQQARSIQQEGLLPAAVVPRKSVQPGVRS